MRTEIAYIRRVGVCHWLFVQDYAPNRGRIINLRYDPVERVFTANEILHPDSGWSGETKLSDREVDILRTLLPAEEIAYCLAATIGASHADS